jgi:hypothetical protein
VAPSEGDVHGELAVRARHQHCTASLPSGVRQGGRLVLARMAGPRQHGGAAQDGSGSVGARAAGSGAGGPAVRGVPGRKAEALLVPSAGGVVCVAHLPCDA